MDLLHCYNNPIIFILQSDNGEEELCSVYVPTNHLYIGDIFLVKSEEIIRPNLSVREGIGLVPRHLWFFYIYFVTSLVSNISQLCLFYLSFI